MDKDYTILRDSSITNVMEQEQEKLNIIAGQFVEKNIGEKLGINPIIFGKQPYYTMILGNIDKMYSVLDILEAVINYFEKQGVQNDSDSPNA